MKLPQISYIHQKKKKKKKKRFFKYTWKEIDQLLLPYKFYGRDM